MGVQYLQGNRHITLCLSTFPSTRILNLCTIYQQEQREKLAAEAMALH